MDISIIIPAYNRAQMLRLTLQSLRSAIQTLEAEILIVDDGSEPPLESLVNEKDIDALPVRFLSQSNQGSIAARLNGLKNATGEFVLFLDSDDVIHPDKLVQQVNQMRRAGVDVSYTDTATAVFNNRAEISIETEQYLPEVSSPIDLYLRLSLLPHNIVYRRNYIQPYLENPIVPPDNRFAYVGDIWIYYNLVPYPAKIAKVKGAYTIYVRHQVEHLSNYWERAGISSLGLILTFVKNLPENQLTQSILKIVGENAFVGWRKLPNNFNSKFEKLIFEIWQNGPKGNLGNLGGKKFQMLAKILGAKNAGWIFRKFQRPQYDKIRTIDKLELEQLMYNLPA